MGHMNYETDEQLQHPIIQRHKKLLQTLSNDRACTILHDEPKKFCLLECCDDYFGHDLTKDECTELSELFGELAEEID